MSAAASIATRTDLARVEGRPLCDERVAVVGAGLAGSLLGIGLGQRGYRVDVYERREDPRLRRGAEGRSINLGLSKRGIRALTEVGLIDEVLRRAVVMRGRVIHTADGRQLFQPYGKSGSEVLHSIDRNELNRLLIDRAAALPGVTFTFRHRCHRLDRSAPALELVDEASGEGRRVTADWVVGADGAFSRVRQEIQRGERADYHQEFLAWGYKELTVPARSGEPDGATGADGRSRIRLEALHLWPRVHCLIVTHPNLDGSHTMTLFLPFEGPDSFATVETEADVGALFGKYFPDVPALIPDLHEQWRRHPEGALVTTRTAPWHLGGATVLVGDACHAVYPFFGQGMNSAFEDCSTLLACLDRHHGERRRAFDEYQGLRKHHTDILAVLSKENFDELNRRVLSPLFRAKKSLDLVLNRIMPRRWMPLYTMIAHTTIPYADALDRARRQDRWLLWTALGGTAALVVLFFVVSRP